MQHLTDQHGNKFTLPASWADVTTLQFCESDTMPDLDQRAAYFAGLPIPAGDKLDWMLTPPAAAPNLLDLGQCCFLAVETIRATLAEGELTKVFARVYGLYLACQLAQAYGKDFDPARAAEKAAACQAWPITDTLPVVLHCIAELQRLAVAYAALAEPDPTDAARRAREAGADELLGMFGHLNTANALSLKLGVTLDAAYQLPYNTVCFYLLHDRQTAILADNIQRNASKPDHAND